MVFGGFVALSHGVDANKLGTRGIATNLGDVDTLACFEAQQAVQDEVATKPVRHTEIMTNM